MCCFLLYFSPYRNLGRTGLVTSLCDFFSPCLDIDTFNCNNKKLSASSSSNLAKVNSKVYQNKENIGTLFSYLLNFSAEMIDNVFKKALYSKE